VPCMVIVSVFASNAIDRGFEPQSGQTKDYKIGIWCFSAKHTALRGKSKMRLSGLTRLFNHMQSCRCFELSTDVTRNIPSYFIITFTVRQVMRGLDFSSRGKNLYDRIISLIEA
jgi:hypothetical protein